MHSRNPKKTCGTHVTPQPLACRCGTAANHSPSRTRPRMCAASSPPRHHACSSYLSSREKALSAGAAPKAAALTAAAPPATAPAPKPGTLGTPPFEAAPISCGSAAVHAGRAAADCSGDAAAAAVEPRTAAAPSSSAPRGARALPGGAAFWGKSPEVPVLAALHVCHANPVPLHDHGPPSLCNSC